MSWTILAPKTDGSEPQVFTLPANATAHIVFTNGFGSVGVVQELRLHPDSVHTELGRITVGPWGAKLEAISDPLSILSGQIHANIPSAGNDPRLEKYQLQPRVGKQSEILFLRHGDVISSPKHTTSLTCRWETAPEVQVNSSAAEAGVQGPNNGLDGADETHQEEETEDEDLDNTITAVKATQSKSQQPQATPQLSHQRSVVIQETPTAARIKSVTDFAVPQMEVDQAEVPEKPTPEEPTEQAEVEPYSTALTGQSQNGETNAVQDLDDLQGKSVSGPIQPFANTTNNQPDDVQTKGRNPKVMISRKRPSPALDEPDSGSEPIGRSSKRAKRTIHSDNDTQDSRLSNIIVDTSPPAAAAAKGRKRKSAVKELEDLIEATSPRSQRSSQRSTTAPTAEPYSGDAPRIATSNSSLTDKSQAVKFLKKQGGSLVDSVKDVFNILCVRDGDLHKTPKVLRAVAAGIPIVTDKWLSDSAKAGQFLSVNAYIPSAPKQEKEWKFKLGDVFSQPQIPFEGYTVHFTTAAHASYKIFTEIEQVCKAAGAEKVTKKKLDKSENVIVFALEEGDKEVEKLMQDGVVCYNRDLLPTSIFRGSLDLDSDEFKVGIKVSDTTGSIATAAKNKRTRKG